MDVNGTIEKNRKSDENDCCNVEITWSVPLTRKMIETK